MRKVWGIRGQGADGQLAGLNKYCQSITINVPSHGDHRGKTLLNNILLLNTYIPRRKYFVEGETLLYTFFLTQSETTSLCTIGKMYNFY